MAEVSVSKAARMTGRGRSTIQRHVKEGKLSAGKDESGNPVIDVSELIRVYGSIKADESGKPDSVKQLDTAEPSQTAQAMIEILREELRTTREAAQEREDWLKRQLEAEQERSRELEHRMLPPGEPGPGEAPKKGFFKRLFGA